MRARPNAAVSGRGAHGTRTRTRPGPRPDRRARPPAACPDPRAVHRGGRRERDLGVARALRGLVGAELHRDPPEVLRPAQDGRVRGSCGRRSGGTRRTPRGPSGGAGTRSAGRRADLPQRRPPDGALQMDVQMRLRQKHQVAHGDKHLVSRRSTHVEGTDGPSRATVFPSLAALEKYGCRVRRIG